MHASPSWHGNDEVATCSPSEAEEQGHDPVSTASSFPQHTVPFKVMGVTKIDGAQNLLIIMSMREMLDRKEDISIILSPEPDNPVDKQANAKLHGRWCTFGYVTKSLTSEVHTALNDTTITEIKLKHVRYRYWQSGPGYYAAVNVTRRGLWSTNVTLHSSTF